MDSFSQSLSTLDSLGFQKPNVSHEDEKKGPLGREDLLGSLDAFLYAEPQRNPKPPASSQRHVK